MNTEIIPFLRLIHIFAGTFWVGSNIFMALFVYPTAKISGESGKTFIGNLSNKNKLPVWMSLSSLITIISGLFMLYFYSSGFSLSFFTTGYGIGLLLGALMAILAFLHGFIKIRPCGIRLGQIGKELSERKTHLSENLKEEIEHLNHVIIKSTTLETFILCSSLAFMIIAKYI